MSAPTRVHVGAVLKNMPVGAANTYNHNVGDHTHLVTVHQHIPKKQHYTTQSSTVTAPNVKMSDDEDSIVHQDSPQSSVEEYGLDEEEGKADEDYEIMDEDEQEDNDTTKKSGSAQVNTPEWERDEEEDRKRHEQFWEEEESEKKKGEEESKKKKSEEEKEEKEKEVEKAYVLFNRAAYEVPPSVNGSGGRVRDHYTPIMVEDATTLGQMSNAKNWPKPESMPPLAIVVVKGVHEEQQKLSADKNKGPFHWYARVVVKKSTSNAHDSKILRPIPKSVVIEFVQHMSQLPHMKTSSLITKYQPEYDNAKPFPVQPNGWKKVMGIKTDAAPVQRAKKEKGADDVFENDEAALSTKETVNGASSLMKKPKSAAADDNKASLHAKQDKKQPSKTVMTTHGSTEAAQSTLAPKKAEASAQVPSKMSGGLQAPKKSSSILQFGRGKTPMSSTEAASSSKDAADEPSVGAKRPASSKAELPDNNLSNIFKKLKRVDCDARDKTTTFWVGNSLFIGEI